MKYKIEKKMRKIKADSGFFQTFFLFRYKVMASINQNNRCFRFKNCVFMTKILTSKPFKNCELLRTKMLASKPSKEL